jgi:broad specificity phosphatase PhoE
VGLFLAGRTAVSLGPEGLAQAERLADHLAAETIDLILCSPCERTRQTANAIAGRFGLRVDAEGALNEIDFGEWSGKTFHDLNSDSRWRRWNSVRSLAATPAGETMRSVQSRVISLMERWHGNEVATVLLVTHADVIKAAVAYYLGLCLNDWSRLTIEPASITTLMVREHGATLYSLNHVVQ